MVSTPSATVDGVGSALPMITSSPTDPVRVSLPPPPSMDVIPMRVTLVKLSTSLRAEPRIRTPVSPLASMVSTVASDRRPMSVLCATATMASAPAPPVTASKPSPVPCEGDGVVTCAGVDGVIAGVAGDDVVLGTGRQTVSAGSSVVLVLTGGACQGVDPGVVVTDTREQIPDDGRGCRCRRLVEANAVDEGHPDCQSPVGLRRGRGERRRGRSTDVRWWGTSRRVALAPLDS